MGRAGLKATWICVALCVESWSKVVHLALHSQASPVYMPLSQMFYHAQFIHLDYTFNNGNISGWSDLLSG